MGNAPNLVEFLEAYLCCHASPIIMLIEPECHFNQIDPYATKVPLGRRSYVLDCCTTFFHLFRAVNVLVD